MNEPVEEYRRRYDAFLRKVADALRTHIEGYLDDTSNIDRVTARAKDPERFEEKARRTDKNGQAKYSKPLTEIQEVARSMEQDFGDQY